MDGLQRPERVYDLIALEEDLTLYLRPMQMMSYEGIALIQSNGIEPFILANREEMSLSQELMSKMFDEET
ncbi:hypothetical protein Tco_1182072 [Tanacetum coccineum]